MDVFEFEQTSGDSEGQGSLACCSPWDHKESGDLATEQQQQMVTRLNTGGLRDKICRGRISIKLVEV